MSVSRRIFVYISNDGTLTRYVENTQGKMESTHRYEMHPAYKWPAADIEALRRAPATFAELYTEIPE